MSTEMVAAPPVHLLIESQGNWNGPNAGRFLEDAAVLAETGQQVTVFLVQDGVFAAVAGALPVLDRLAALAVPVWVDDFSLAQRALSAERLAGAASVVGMDAVAGMLLSETCRVVWH